MSIVLILQEDNFRKSATFVAKQIADSYNTDITVFVLSSSRADEKLKEISNASIVGNDYEFLNPLINKSKEESRYKAYLVSPDSVIEKISALEDKEKIELLVVNKSSSRSQNKLLSNLVSRIHCQTLVLRINVQREEKLKKILVAVGSGPNSINGLMLSNQIADYNMGQTTALFVQKEIGEISSDLGSRKLKKILKKSNLKDDDNTKERIEVGISVSETIVNVSEENFDLVIIGAAQRSKLRNIVYGDIAEGILSSENSAIVGVILSPQSITKKVHKKIEGFLDLRVPQLNREDRVSLFEVIENGSTWNFDFVTLISLSTAIAAIGLIQNSTAVVIGAMLVAPLMTPLLGAGLSISQANYPLVKSSFHAIFFGFLTAIAIGFCITFICGADILTEEVLNRGAPNILDLYIALLSGVAAAYCTARPGLSGALPGVAIAAALVPPIASSGIALAIGNFAISRGAFLLFFTNIIAIIFGASFCFYAIGARNQLETEKNWGIKVFLILALIGLLLILPLSGVLK